MRDLTIRLEDPRSEDEFAARNQRFIIIFPGDVLTDNIEKSNVLISYDDGTIVWCSVAIDDDYPNKLFIYPSVLLQPYEKITLYVSDILVSIDGEDVETEIRYWHFDVSDVILQYPDDEIASNLIPDVDTSGIGGAGDDLCIILTNPSYGSSFISGDKKIEIVFNKDLSPIDDIKDYIEIEKTHVLL